MSWKPHEVIVLIITITVVGVVLLIVGGIMFRGAVPELGIVDKLLALISSLIAIVTLFVGAALQKRYGKDGDIRDETPNPTEEKVGDPPFTARKEDQTSD